MPTTTLKPFTISPWQRYNWGNRRYYVKGLPTGAAGQELTVYFDGPWGSMSPTGDWHALSPIEQRLAELAIELYCKRADEQTTEGRMAEINKRETTYVNRAERLNWQLRRTPEDTDLQRLIAFELQLSEGRNVAIMNNQAELDSIRRSIATLEAMQAQLLGELR